MEAPHTPGDSSSVASPIPRLIHQTWKTASVPERWQTCQGSWQRHHPQWQYRLWTDEDNRSFLAEHDPWFLPIYDAYPEPIMRVDAFRYFLMYRLGGVYVDVDFECLKPLDALLDPHEVVLGLEPDAHTDKLLARERGLTHIVCNAFLASRPGHPFWEHVIKQLVASHKAPGVLDATGPFMLTGALDAYEEPGGVYLAPASALYPRTAPDSRAGSDASPDVDPGEAYAVHHWAGSWIQEPSGSPRSGGETSIAFRLTDRVCPVLDGELDVDAARHLWAGGRAQPLVSCLMVTARRTGLAWRAIQCFRAQTYPARELVIINDDPDPELHDRVTGLGDERIRHVRLPPQGTTLGALRNIAVSHARGDLVAQWDDDDLYDPERIEVQVAALESLAADVCLLRREQMWWPATRRLATSPPRAWEGSMLARRSAMGLYPEQRRGEDTALMTRLIRGARAVILDAPWLYIYVFHGANTFDAGHFAELFDAAEAIDEGCDYVQAVIALSHRLPIDLSSILDENEAPPPSSASIPESGETRPDGEHATPHPVVTDELPSVLVLTPVRNASPFLERYFENLSRLDYDPQQLTLGLLESDSTDGTWSRIERASSALSDRFADVTTLKRDFGVRLPGPRYASEHQRERRAVLARSRNTLLSGALRDEDWVLWLDVDVTQYPPDLIQRLLGAGKDIVTAHCVTRPGGPSFDLNTFVLSDEAPGVDWSRHVRDGILQPPRGLGRRYLDELRDHALVQVDSVGGTALLIRADLHREGLCFPAYPHALHIETEGLAMMARDLGMACWAMPQLEVVHPPHG